MLVQEPEDRPWVDALLAVISDTELNLCPADTLSYCRYYHLPTGAFDLVAVDALLRAMARRIAATSRVAAYLVYFHQSLKFPITAALSSLAGESPSTAVRTASFLLQDSESPADFLQDPDHILKWIFLESGPNDFRNLSSIFRTFVKHFKHAVKLRSECNYWMEVVLTKMPLLPGERLEAVTLIGTAVTGWRDAPEIMYEQLYYLVLYVKSNFGDGAVRLFLDQIQYDQRIGLDPRLILPNNSHLLIRMPPCDSDFFQELPTHHQIIFVDSMESLQRAASILLSADIVGLDTETKPVFRKGGKPNPVALLQISSREHSFIFDLLYFGDRTSLVHYHHSRDVMFSVFATLFLDPCILKVGMQFGQDLQQLYHNYPDPCFARMEAYLEVTDLFHYIFEGYSLPSLKKLVRYCTGMKLNKTCQRSDWSRRPLNVKQLSYAALDAHVLISIAETLFFQGEAREQQDYGLHESLHIKSISGINPKQKAPPVESLEEPPPSHRERRPSDV